MDKAIIAGLTLNQNQYELNQSLEELANLALTLQIEVVDRITQNRFKPTPNLYFGRGKIEEIKMSITHYEADILIVDDTLSPAQIRNLEASLEIQIIDRSFLILQIFSLRAQSKEAILEVKLAQNQYMLPRLVGLGKSLSRQGGGTYNAKGPGETKLEMDRRKLLDEISKINKELKIINKQRTQARIQRKKNEIPVVSLVGYTNAGKSAILNNLSLLLSNSNQLAFEENILFATLDTKSRLLQKENNPPFILIDTVGFISKLPPELI
ncbi:MAG: GTPase HflX, partial [Acholeplasmataceae bacterium]|nr:GTPase HflX [Acholeplasmataceae bacterium]